ncbi:MAG: hypothetical protein ABIL62_17800 [Planctomycetota bacterium]
MCVGYASVEGGAGLSRDTRILNTLGGPAHKHPPCPRPRRLPTGAAVRRRALRRGETPLLTAAPPGMGRFGLPASVNLPTRSPTARGSPAPAASEPHVTHTTAAAAASGGTSVSTNPAKRDPPSMMANRVNDPLHDELPNRMSHLLVQ